TGRLPFSGHSPISIALKHLQNDTPSVKRFNENIPQSVENIVLKATAKNPFHRYRNVYELQEALEMALDPESLNEPEYTPPVEAEEETKAIPIITEDHLDVDNNEDTIIHNMNEDTKVVPEDPPKKKKTKKKRKWKRWVFGILGVSLLSVVLLLFLILQPR